MNNPIGTWTLFKRETHRFLKIYKQTVFAPVLSNLLFLAIFGLSLRRTIPIEGISYLQFLIPGLVMLGIINNAYQSPSSSLIIMKYQNLMLDFLTIPLSTFEKLLGFIGSGVIRGLIVGLVTYLTGLLFVGFPYTSITIILLSSVLVSLFFALLGFIIGIYANEFDKQALIQNFILTPLVFLGGVFYPISVLPEVAQKIFLYNPIVYMIDLLRYGFTGVHSFPITTSLIILTALTLLLTVLAYFILRSGWRLQT